MSADDRLKDINESMQDIADKKNLEEINESLKQISASLKPKEKKTQWGIVIAWIIIGIVLLYMLYDLSKIV